MAKVKYLILTVVSLLGFNAGAHGIPNNSCWFGGDDYLNSTYTCHIFYNNQFVQFDDIFSGKLEGWNLIPDIYSASFTTPKGTLINLVAAVSCPLEKQKPDPRTINISVTVGDKFYSDVSLRDASVLPGRTLTAVFEVEKGLAYVACRAR